VQIANLTLYPVSYDFDYSGLVNTGYGAADKRLNLSSVRERLYRGPCKTMQELTPFLEMVTANKDKVLALIERVPDMKPERQREARDYLSEFFSIAANPGRAKRALVDNCAKAVGM
jgi:hypothetical protein